MGAGLTTSSTDRSYELLAGEPPAEGLRRLAAGRADSALENLRAAAAGEPGKGIHESRKDLKKLRSVLRLVREGLGENLYDGENARYRKAGRLLSDARDAAARLETVDALRARAGDGFPGEGTRRWSVSLGQRRRQHLEDADRPLQEAIALVEEGRERIAQWPLDGASFELVGDGLLRAYRRGRKRGAAVAEGPSQRRVHEWRKRVKDLWYMQSVLKPLWPAMIGPAAEQAHDLSSLLGDHHDVAVLAGDATGRPDLFDGDGLAELLELCRRRQAELLAEAVPLGRRIYAERPKGFLARYAAYWRSPAAADG